MGIILSEIKRDLVQTKSGLLNDCVCLPFQLLYISIMDSGNLFLLPRVLYAYLTTQVIYYRD